MPASQENYNPHHWGGVGLPVKVAAMTLFVIGPQLRRNLHPLSL